MASQVVVAYEVSSRTVKATQRNAASRGINGFYLTDLKDEPSCGGESRADPLRASRRGTVLDFQFKEHCSHSTTSRPVSRLAIHGAD